MDRKARPSGTTAPVTKLGEATEAAARGCQDDPGDPGPPAALQAAMQYRLLKLARRFPRSPTCDADDLVGAGWVAVIETALPRWDRRVSRFSTYATLWIRHAMTAEFARNGYPVALPVHLAGADPEKIPGSDAAKSAVATARRPMGRSGLDRLPCRAARGAADTAAACPKDRVAALVDRLEAARPDLASVVREHLGIGCDPSSLVGISRSRGKANSWAYVAYASATEAMKYMVADPPPGVDVPGARVFNKFLGRTAS